MGCTTIKNKIKQNKQVLAELRFNIPLQYGFVSWVTVTNIFSSAHIHLMVFEGFFSFKIMDQHLSMGGDVWSKTKVYNFFCEPFPYLSTMI